MAIPTTVIGKITIIATAALDSPKAAPDALGRTKKSPAINPTISETSIPFAGTLNLVLTSPMKLGMILSKE